MIKPAEHSWKVDAAPRFHSNAPLLCRSCPLLQKNYCCDQRQDCRRENRERPFRAFLILTEKKASGWHHNRLINCLICTLIWLTLLCLETQSQSDRKNKILKLWNLDYDSRSLGRFNAHAPMISLTLLTSGRLFQILVVIDFWLEPAPSK